MALKRARDGRRALALDKRDGLDGLTSKMQLFVSAVFSGASDMEAYRRAYNAENMNATTLGSSAHELRHHPLVVAKLRELQDKRDSQTSLAPSLTRDFVIGGLINLAQSAEKDTVKLGAYIALGKVAGIDLFRDIKVMEKRERSTEDIDRDLERMLRGLNPILDVTPGGATIDGEARPTPAPVPKDRRRKPQA